MSLRFAIGGISHETNTYCKDPTPISDFRILRGQEITEAHRGVRTYIGGMLDAARRLDATAVPTLFANATPSGTIAAGAYGSMKEELLDSIRAALPLDAVALCLHGAGVAEGVDDLEGDLCQAVRTLVGPAVPIVVTLDLHGNLTQAMADVVQCMFGVHHYPHTDMYERGDEAVTIIPRLLTGQVRPVTRVETVRMLVPTSASSLEPVRSINRFCAEMEKEPGVIDCTFFHGFPYTDIPHVGVHIVVTTDGDPDLAGSVARRVGAYVWGLRDGFTPNTLTPQEAIAAALAVDGCPVVINDTSDNPGGGSPGDGTQLLRAMLEADLKGACFGFVYDPEVAAAAHSAGVGATIQVSLGGKYDDFHGAPLEITAYVKCLTDGKFIRQSPMGRGSRVDQGKMARLVVGGVDILVASVRSQTLDAEIFLLHGIDVTRCKIVGLKSSQHFRAGFDPIAKAIITADSPGLTTLRLEVFPRKRSPRSWPLDPGYVYA